MMDYSFTEARDDDWSWVLQGSAEAVWASLPEARRKQIGREAINRHYEEEARDFHGEERFPNSVILARDSAGERCGFIWVAQITNDGTGRPHGFIMDIYLDPSHRGTGLAQVLMQQAEAWCRVRGLKYIQLSVAPFNTPAYRLYQKLGYLQERQILSKDL
jgi:RimJ/RimL family protein N-acetyltransferase